MIKQSSVLAGLLWALLCCALVAGCTNATTPNDVTSGDPGVKQLTIKTQTDADGLTAEQRNVRRRIQEDNKTGSVKFLYLLNATTSECVMFSMVANKITSGGKHLIPGSVESWSDNSSSYGGFTVNIHGSEMVTQEVLGDDGTYGHSGEYFFWFRPDGAFFQVIPGSATVLISDRPVRVKKTEATVDLTTH